MGKLIVFEGVDGSGKSTQYAALCARLEAEGKELRKLVFPRYDKDSSALIRMYLGGEFGSRPGDVNAYAASTFFAVDRYASYKQDWGAYYEAGGLLVTDRYTTSNAVHQASKLPQAERGEFLRWLFELEYERMGLPEPDLVLLLDVDPALSAARLRHREASTDTKADIHEQDADYLAASIEAARHAAELCGWTRISCGCVDAPRSIEEISCDVWEAVKKLWTT